MSNSVHPKILLSLEWESYLIRLETVRAHNEVQDKILEERGIASFIEMPVYDNPLDMAAGGVWQKNIQIIR